MKMQVVIWTILFGVLVNISALELESSIPNERSDFPDIGDRFVEETTALSDRAGSDCVSWQHTTVTSRFIVISTSTTTSTTTTYTTATSTPTSTVCTVTGTCGSGRVATAVDKDAEIGQLATSMYFTLKEYIERNNNKEL